MNQTYALLKTDFLKENTRFTPTVQKFDIAHLEEPALTVMTDFQKRPPYTTVATTSIHEALQQMKLLGVKSLFVVNADNNIIGHVSTRDIQGNKAAMLAHQYDLKLTEVTVKMLMVRPQELHTLNFEALSNVRVGHIVRLFHELNVNYIFVLGHDNNLETLRGLFSISTISQRLGENVLTDLSSQSVAEMNKIFNL
jgi:signal-transduction protein with cAMP-binding, CBS, and nucleotidyltransferase domain